MYQQNEVKSVMTTVRLTTSHSVLITEETLFDYPNNHFNRATCLHSAMADLTKADRENV